MKMNNITYIHDNVPNNLPGSIVYYFQ